MSRRRIENGVRLNYPEAIAVICDEILERAREGSIPMLHGYDGIRRHHS